MHSKLKPGDTFPDYLGPVLAKGREATDNDARVTQMWEEIAMVRHARRVQAAEQELKTADNPQTREACETGRGPCRFGKRSN